MTNIEHYGFNNLIFEDHQFTSEDYLVEIYYRTKHSKNNINLLKEFTSNPREVKVKWLLEEYKPWREVYPSDYITIYGRSENGGWVRGYRMKHHKKEY